MKGTNVLGLMYQISHSVQLAKFHMIYFYVGHAVVMIHRVNKNYHSQLDSSCIKYCFNPEPKRTALKPYIVQKEHCCN